MNLVNDTPFDVFVMASQIDPPRPSATIIVKGTFALQPDAVATPLPDEEQDKLKPDEPFMDEIGRSLAWASDLEPHKPFAELVVHGHVYPPGGQPAPTALAAVRIGEWEKRIAAFGDRIWTRAPDGTPAPTEPRPFAAIPLRWEFSFGGLDNPRNPMGRGIDTEIEISQGVSGIALPNIENPDALVTSPEDQPEPVNLGPVPQTYEARYRKLGTRDKRWATFRAPLPPDDFDASYHNAAPEDQQFETPFKGDEIVELEGLHPHHPVLRFQLPSLRLRAFVVRDVENGPTVEETPLEIDTLAIQPDEDKLTVLWRGYCAVAKEAMEDLIGVHLAQEPLAEPAQPAAAYLPGITEKLFPAPPADDSEIDAEVGRAMDEAKSLLDKVDLPDDVKARLKAEQDPVKLFDSLIDEIHRQAEAIQRSTSGIG